LTETITAEEITVKVYENGLPGAIISILSASKEYIGHIAAMAVKVNHISTRYPLSLPET
jgi:hypothetical protein